MIKRILTSTITTFLILLLVSPFSQSQTVYTFTTCGATGRVGPTQAQVNTAYSATNLMGSVTVTGGIQYWTVPNSGFYTISAVGAQGGGANGGLGASMEGEFFLNANQVIRILVGQQGLTQPSNPTSVGGGGGTFVVSSPATTTGDILVIAGGGGGAPSTSYATRHASAGTSGNNGHVDAGVSNPDGVGGTNGAGGHKSVSGCSLDRGAGGGGFLTDGQSVCQSVGIADGGDSFLNGGQGGNKIGTAGIVGSFGGGGATWQTGFRGAGGGGGYSGGGAGQINNATNPNLAGGGGGSYNAGSNQVNVAGNNTGDGLVVITQFPTSPNDAGVTNILSPLSGCDGSTQNVEVEVTNLGTNQITSVEVHWTINNVAQTVYNYSGLLDTANGTGSRLVNLVIGNMTFVANNSYDIVAWTEMPNNVVDTENANDTSDVTVQGYPYPTVNLGLDSTICTYDSILLDAGAGRDSILWSTSATSRTIFAGMPQTYMVDVWENGCLGGDTFVLTSFPAPPVFDLGNDTMICYGDSILLDATVAGATYLWHDNSTGPTYYADTIGNYSVIVEDNNTCKTSDDINVSLFSTPLISLSVIPRNTICYGAPFEFRASSFTQGSTMYQWKINTVNSGAPTTNNKFSPSLMYGDSVNVDLLTDVCNTTVVESNYIVMYLKPEPKLISGSAVTDSVLENTSKNYLVPVVTGSTFTWDAVGGAIASPVGNAVQVDWGPKMDTAKIMVTEKDAANCSYTNVRNVVIYSTVGYKDENHLIGIGHAYPNPANTTVTIPLLIDGNWDIELSLYDMTGKKVKAVYNGEVSGNRNFTFVVDDLQNGMYFYKVTTDDGYESVKKLSIKH